MWDLGSRALFWRNRGVKPGLRPADLTPDVISTSWSEQSDKSGPPRPVEKQVRELDWYGSFSPTRLECVPSSKTVGVEECVEAAEPAPVNQG